ncbi:MAG: hypothetical protein Ct9H300mP10_10500 [Methanobacteriota archaeon]|nr:MAG: hypothetical protein Ct9H300mP10_10500 [Euryarchaeota archaeon]
MVEVDSLDRAKLSVLRHSGRAPFVDIAKQVDVTERTVRTRMRRLEDQASSEATPSVRRASD